MRAAEPRTCRIALLPSRAEDGTAREKPTRTARAHGQRVTSGGTLRQEVKYSETEPDRSCRHWMWQRGGTGHQAEAHLLEGGRAVADTPGGRGGQWAER